MSNKWIAQAYGIDALVDDKGEILASVSAKNAAERDHGGVEAMTTPSLPNYSAGAR